MSAQVKEAMAALVTLGNFGDGPGYNVLDAHPEELSVIRSALEAAQQEAEAWEAIRQWSNAAFGEVEVVMGERIDEADIVLRSDDGDREDFMGDSRLEALTKAATWCRAELDK